MSSTRHAAAGAPFRQERYASSEAFDIGLNAGLVAQRCELLGPEVASLIWFLQFRSLPPRDGVGGRIGGMNRVATELLPFIDLAPVVFEDWDLTPGKKTKPRQTPEKIQAVDVCAVAQLAEELTKLCLDPQFDKSGMNLRRWIAPLAKYRERCVSHGKAKLAETSISAVVWDALEFTRGTSEAALIVGEPRIGKSETAKVFCESQGGLARYVEVPATNDERSIYRAVAEALGVACGLGYKAVEIRERVVEVLRRSKLMLVFDEAQNLWTRNMRPRSSPDRVLWINSLINMGVPVALVALPEFTTWMEICAEKTGWSSRQIEQRITIFRRLPDVLTEDDFQALARHLAPFLSAPAITFLVGCAMEQDGAAFVKKVLSAATYRAAKAGRAQPSFDDIRAAVRDDIMPSAKSLRDALVSRQATRGRPAKVAPALQPTATLAGSICDAIPIAPRAMPASPVHRARNGVAVPTHGAE